MRGGYRGGRHGPPKHDDDGSSSSIPKGFYDSLRRRIDDFKVGPHDRLVFEPMDRSQRKAVHDMANRLRVISKSSGEGTNRHCVITRRPAPTMQAATLCSESEPVALTPEQKSAIVAFIASHPISDQDIDEHVTVSREARDSVRESRKFHAPRSEPQVPPKSNGSPEIMRTREELPAYQWRGRVIEAVEKNKVTLITGGTGCGKTTQVPQFILERANECGTPVRIIVTQPRRLPAIAVAQRVAMERREPLPGTVGYHIRLEQKTCAQTVLTYCTSGVLLRMLTQDELARDCTHIILDEVHEREQNTDYLLIALKQALRKRADLKVILMSATMEGNLEMFLGYFKDHNIAHVDIPSRLYPVTNFHLADVMALTGYTPPESVYGGIATFGNSNGFRSFGGGGGGGQTKSGTGFSVGNWGGKDTFASATTWNNSEAKMIPTASSSYHKTPPNSLATNSSTSVATAAAAAGVRAVQSAANLPTYGNGSAAPAAAAPDPSTFMSLAQKLASAGGTMQPMQQQQDQMGGAYGNAAAAAGGMHRSASMGYPAHQQQQQQMQYGQQQQYGNMQQPMQQQQPAATGSGYYGQSLSWESSPPYGSQCEIVDLPMDEDDRMMTMQANQQLYGGGGGGGYGGSWNDGRTQQQMQQQSYGGRPAAAAAMQQQQYPQQQQAAYGGYAYMQQPQMQQDYHHSGAATAAGSAGHGMYQYHQYQSQPNMQLQQQSQQAQWSQQQQMQQSQQQPTFYVPESSTAGQGYFVQPGMNGMQQQQMQQGGGAAAGGAAASSSFMHRSTSAAAALNDGDQYGMGLREEENARQSMVMHIQNIIHPRPPVFCSEAIDALASVGHMLDRRGFTEFYRAAGGAQWEESVDVELALATVRYLMESPINGAILVFLPGYEDIQALKDKLMSERWGETRPSLCLLHSQLNSNDQQRVFEPTKGGERKVILSTNIAEASLTIDDVVFVVDCGKAKEKTYDHASRISQLKCVWIAKSNAEQRRGRAGRCRPGYCFRLYSDEEFDAMLPSQVAEMQRSAIHDVCLHAKMFAPERMSVKEFLQLAPEPPETEAVDSSLQFLEQLGALYTELPPADDSMFPSSSTFRGLPPRPREPELTQLGRLVAHLPLDPQLARLLLFGYALRCFNPIVTLVALLSHRDPFTLAVGEEKQAALAARDSFAHRDFSDHLMILRAFSAYSAIPSNGQYQNQAQMKLCREKYLSAPTLKMVNGIRRQLLLELRRIRFINEVEGALEDAYLNEYSNKWPMVQAAIVAGSYPCIGFVKGSKMRKIRTYTDSHSQLHPSSSLKRQMLSQEKRHEHVQKYYQGEPTIEYLAFQEFVKIEEGLTLRTATAIPSVTIFLFAGPIRLSKDKLLSYFVSAAEEDLGEDAMDGGADRDFFQPRDILELESWLSVKGCMGDFIRLMQLRFKVMEYVLSVMRTPVVINEGESKKLLSTLSRVLDIEHKTKGFSEVNDVYRQSQYSPTNNPLKRAASSAAAAAAAAGGSAAEAYDFGAATSSSNNSYREERKKPDQPFQHHLAYSAGSNNNGNGSYYHNNSYHHGGQQQGWKGQQQQQQYQNNLQQQRRGDKDMRGAAAAAAAAAAGGADKGNWRETMRPASATPPPQQQQPKKQYPDPYRDKQREERKEQQQRPQPEFKKPQLPPQHVQQRHEEKPYHQQQQRDERGNGYGREERSERQDAPRYTNTRRGSTVGSRLNEKRNARPFNDEDYGNGAGSSNRYQGGGGRQNQGRYEDEDDGANDGVPEDPRVYDREPSSQQQHSAAGAAGSYRESGRQGYGGYQQQKRGGGFGGGAGAGQRYQKHAEPAEEEDWGKSATAPHFYSKEGGGTTAGGGGAKRGGGRTFVNTNFMNKGHMFKGMHSDRMEGRSGGSRDDERDAPGYSRPRTGSRTARE